VRPRGPEGRDAGFECVEPELGEQVWRLQGSPAADVAATGAPLAPELRTRLLEHVRICDACRLRLAFGRQVAAGLASGRLHLPRSAASVPGRRAVRLFAWAGVAAAAAGLAMLLLMPPLPVDAGRLERGDGRPQFLRPVEGEVLSDLTPTLSWRPVAGATAYRLVVRQVGGSYRFETATGAVSAAIPAATPLPRGADLRAVVEPVPADLAAPGEITVAFRTGSAGQALLHRVSASGTGPRVAGALALVLLLASLLTGRLARAGARQARVD
jgi:uncharacterized membrane protein YtjA (UPF0391 family)